MKKQGYMPKSKSQTHLTPDRVYEMIEQEWGIEKEKLYDPCPANTPYKSPCFFNGLYGIWGEFNYINPPFEVKTLTKFVEKAIQLKTIFHVISIMLLPVKTDQDWWHDYMVPNLLRTPQNFKWIKRRLKFKNNKDCSMSSHFLVLIE